MDAVVTNISHDLVINAAKLTGVKQSRIYSTCRTDLVASIRWAIFVVLRRKGWSLSEIGDAFGKTHGAVICGLRNASSRLDDDKWFSALVSSLTQSINQ